VTHFLPLRTRVKSAFVKAGVTWPSPASRAIPLGGAALQCKTMRSAALICDVVSDNDKLMHRNAVLLVLLCSAAGMDGADTWIAGELRAAVTEARKTVKVAGRTRFTLAIDHPPRLIVLKVEERL
jgi:hypothetical protein